ncbi:MAG: hypothetical protein M1469_07880 [Bacteroidetes bacterium]|nr:hypothetical protein [Bacteroidota bacterium]
MKSSSGRKRCTSRRESYVFAFVFSFIILALLVVINMRPEIIEKIVRSLIGPPK